jgi:catechol 2,3-dioxygenase-like lactoylglutathione lyase family enzyme
VTPRLDMIGLAVRDLAASLAFYRRLGLDIPEGAENSEHGHVEASLPGGLRVAWDTHGVMESFDPGWKPASGGSSSITLAFLVDSPAEVDSLYAELTRAGYEGHLEPWDAFWGQRYAIVYDPDGNDVALFSPQP